MSIPASIKRTKKIIWFLIQDFYTLDWLQFDKFLYDTMRETGMKPIAIWADILTAVFMYQVSILEYFYYRFYELPYARRARWVGKGFMFLFQEKVASHLLNKSDNYQYYIYEKFKKLFIHTVFFNQTYNEKMQISGNLFTTDSHKLVFTSLKQRLKEEIFVVKKEDLDEEKLLRLLEKSHFDRVEDFVYQHDVFLSCYSDSGRAHKIFLFTNRLKTGYPEVIGCTWAIPFYDTYLLAPIDFQTGLVIGAGASPDIVHPNYKNHPLTGEAILGVQIPFWEECVNIALEGALLADSPFWTWELIVSKNGPGLYAAWPEIDTIIWQLPSKKGLKHILV